MDSDFASLSGEQFEDLCEDLLKAMGYDDPPPERSGRGADGGRDLIVTEHLKSGISGASQSFRWLVQCKNNAKANRSVKRSDIDPILDKLSRHRANGYLLITSTIPSTDLEADIRAIDGDPKNGVRATYWSGSKLADDLDNFPAIYDKYFGRLKPKRAFELAVASWQSDNILESGQRLGWYYQHRESLNIDVDALTYLLLCHTGSNKPRDGILAILSLASDDPSRDREHRIEWIEYAKPSVCLLAIDRILGLLQDGRCADDSVSLMLIDLCTAPHSELQHGLLDRINSESISQLHPLFIQAYIASPIPDQKTLDFLQHVAISDGLIAVRAMVIYRLLRYYRKVVFSHLYLPEDKSRTQKWREAFPYPFLANPEFRLVTFEYLNSFENQPAKSYFIDLSYRLEMLKMLYEHEPEKVVEVLWGMVRIDYHSRFIGAGATEILQLLRVYDPDKTLQEAVRIFRGEMHYHESEVVLFLEMMNAPETNTLLAANIRRYVEKFKNGSKHWSGGNLTYWRQSLKDTVRAAARQQLLEVVPDLEIIALRWEPDQVISVCMDALVRFADHDALPILIKLLDSTSKGVRDRSKKHLVNMKQFHNEIGDIVSASIVDPSSVVKSWLAANRTERIATKLEILVKIKDPRALELADKFSREGHNETVKKLASEYAALLRQPKKSRSRPQKTN